MTSTPDQTPAFVIPEGWVPLNLSRCRSCGETIMWCLTKRDKRAPIDRDGISHFATCPQAPAWRRRRGR